MTTGVVGSRIALAIQESSPAAFASPAYFDSPATSAAASTSVIAAFNTFPASFVRKRLRR